jgi:hypothetical protein
MAAKSRKTKVSPAALGAAGAIPLALALTVGNLSPGGGSTTPASDPNASVKCAEGIENFSGCHPSYPTGCSVAGKYDGYLNFLKNKEPARNLTPVKFFTSSADYQNLDTQTPKISRRQITSTSRTTLQNSVRVRSTAWSGISIM